MHIASYKGSMVHELYANLPLEVDYNTLINSLGCFERIGKSLCKLIPVQGKLGYAGACFFKRRKSPDKYTRS